MSIFTLLLITIALLFIALFIGFNMMALYMAYRVLKLYIAAIKGLFNLHNKLVETNQD